MVKIINKAKSPVRVDEIPVGECFMYRSDVYMRVKYNNTYASVRFATGCIQTNIHNDEKVMPVNVTIEVGG